MRALALGISALSLLGLTTTLAAACSSFEGVEAAPAADAGPDVAPAPPPAACAEPKLVDDPAAKPDDRCGPDGAVVDLTSDQAHCGACRHACEQTSQCTNGLCSPSRIFANDPLMNALVVGGTAYAVDTNRRVVRGLIDGGRVEPFDPGLLLTAGTVVRRLAKDETWLYLSSSTGPQRVSLVGRNREPLPIESTEPDGIVALGATLYFYASASGVESHTLDGTIKLKAPSPGTKNVVADGDEAYWVATVGDTTSLRGPFPESDVVVSARSIDAVALDVDYIYFGDSASRQIRRVPRSGGSSQPVASEPGTAIGAVAVDGDYVYWTADRGPDGWAAMRVPKCGGVALTLATTQPALTQLSFDATRLFVARITTSTVADFVSLAK